MPFTYQTENTPTYSYQTENLSDVSGRVVGSPIGLLLTITQGATSFNYLTENAAASYTYQTENVSA